MTEMYHNEAGKSRPLTEDAVEQSQKRREWFDNFEKRLIPRLPDELQSVKFQIVGSVKDNAASEESDIDIVIRYKGSSPTAEAIIRNEIAKLIKEMKENDEITFDVEVQQPGNPHQFSAIAMFKRQQH
ncbi:MAG: nucleotidyltransferase domain-containing protein [Candidatus Pacebacteria bacterium]|nr:nucleotidyltransferase domain-containing protein [Candidatus Paceibacterota bacterium]